MKNFCYSHNLREISYKFSTNFRKARFLSKFSKNVHFRLNRREISILVFKNRKITILFFLKVENLDLVKICEKSRFQSKFKISLKILKNLEFSENFRKISILAKILWKFRLVMMFEKSQLYINFRFFENFDKNGDSLKKIPKIYIKSIFFEYYDFNRILSKILTKIDELTEIEIFRHMWLKSRFFDNYDWCHGICPESKKFCAKCL